jgi:hypothetical protein
MQISMCGTRRAGLGVQFTSLEVLTRTWTCRGRPRTQNLNADLDVHDMQDSECRAQCAELDMQDSECRARCAELDIQLDMRSSAACQCTGRTRTLQAKLNARNYRATKPLPDTLISTQPERDEHVSATTVLTVGLNRRRAAACQPLRRAGESAAHLTGMQKKFRVAAGPAIWTKQSQHGPRAW